jgi:hypothetical protein
MLLCSVIEADIRTCQRHPNPERSLMDRPSDVQTGGNLGLMTVDLEKGSQASRRHGTGVEPARDSVCLLKQQ